MKRTKKLYILLGVLVVICIATFVLSKTEEKKENILLMKRIQGLQQKQTTGVTVQLQEIHLFHSTK